MAPCCAVDVGPIPVPSRPGVHTFAASMSSTAGPEKKPVPPDEVDRLEEMHQRMKEKQEAWRKLLENLDHLKKKSNDNNNGPGTETPSR